MQATAKERRLDERHILKLERTYGIPRDFAEAAGLFSANSPDEVARYTGSKPPEGGGIVISYNAPGYYRVRLDVPYTDSDGDTVKYLAPAGRGNHLYVPPGVDLSAPVVVITEGELKALCAAARGIPCVAVAGIDAWRQRTALGEKLPPDEALLPELRRDWSGQKIILIYDSDIGPTHERWEAYPQLAEQLYRLNAAEVKIITLPRLASVNEKIGLDDYLVRYERNGENGVARFWSLVEHTPIWLPTGNGAEKFAAKELASDDPERQIRGAAALIGRYGDLVAKAKLKVLGIKDRGLWREAKKYLAEAQKRQAPKPAAKPKDHSGGQPQQGRQGGSTGQGQQQPRTIAAAFPPAAQVVSPELQFPSPAKHDSEYDIRGGKVILVTRDERGEEHERAVLDTVALLTRRLVPLERAADDAGWAGDEWWELIWWEGSNGGRWVREQVPADWLFDPGQKRYLIRTGLPVTGNNFAAAADWFHSLRSDVVHRDAPVPTSWTVSRCGWFRTEKGWVFVLGREVLTVDAKGLEIIWAEIGDQEKQILSAFSVKGDPGRQRDFLLEMIVKYPLVAYGVGNACAAPLIHLLDYAPDKGIDLDVAGWTVAMVPTTGGRSRHQGKTCWQRIAASLFGYPSERGGLLRSPDRTRAATAILYAVCSDLPVFMEDIQIILQGKRDAAVEVDFWIHQVAKGQERARAAKDGTGQRTRHFRNVAFWTSEIDVLSYLPPESGAADRVFRLPPLLPEESLENQNEAERIERETLSHYGHAGRAYIRYLLHRLAEDERGFLAELAEEYRDAVEHLRGLVGEGPAKASAGRLAKRAGLAIVGLRYLLAALGVPENGVDPYLESFTRGWETAVGLIPSTSVAETAWRAVQSLVAANTERIWRLRKTEKPPAPAGEWIGAKTVVTVQDGRRVEVIAVREEEFSRAVKTEPFNLDPEHARRALAEAGYLLTRTVKQDGREKRLTTFQVTLAGVRVPALCFPADLLLAGDGDDGAGAEEDRDVGL